MSRVAKSPVTIPAGVDVSIKEDRISVKGAGGSLLLWVLATRYQQSSPIHRPGHSRPTRPHGACHGSAHGCVGT